MGTSDIYATTLLSQSFGIAGDAYDTAWVASIADEKNPQVSHFPDSLNQLIKMQYEDGSWGSEIGYIHDRILSTLTALATVATFNSAGAFNNSIEYGTHYLWKYAPHLLQETIIPVGFELLLPALVERATQAGIRVPHVFTDIYRLERSQKLNLIPEEILYSPKITLCHSLEFLGKDVDVERIKKTQASNGSIGNSPAATAYFYQLTKNPEALTYLKHLAEKDSAIPVLSPCKTFELLWAAYHLYLVGIPATKLLTKEWQDLLQKELNENKGVSLSPSFPIPDADDTAVALLLLSDANIPCHPEILENFALASGYYASFPYERHPSVGVNLHVLHAILHFKHYPNRDELITNLVEFILSQQTDNFFWTDKWHISPFYATSHALRVMAKLPPKAYEKAKPKLLRAREWVRQTQNRDGSWGFYSLSTPEETAFAVLSLASDNIVLDKHDKAACKKAYHYLKEKMRDKPENIFYPLWMDKCVYEPTYVVKAIIESAFIVLKTLFPEEEDITLSKSL